METDEGGVQRAVCDDEALGLVHEAVHGDGHFDTLTIRDREYVLVATPTC